MGCLTESGRGGEQLPVLSVRWMERAVLCSSEAGVGLGVPLSLPSGRALLGGRPGSMPMPIRRFQQRGSYRNSSPPPHLASIYTFSQGAGALIHSAFLNAFIFFFCKLVRRITRCAMRVARTAHRCSNPHMHTRCAEAYQSCSRQASSRQLVRVH